ncbi:MAG TPA: hypothetical protein VMJ10_19255 [Kofleriaceae bacterium]|nr:hypothetical protein [Kofleriaceae bacterium]
MKRIALASLLVASTAVAQKVPSCPPAKGDPLFVIDHQVRSGLKGVTSKIEIYDGGAWIRTGADEDGKAQPVQVGCLDKDTLAKMRADIKGAPWTVKHNRVHCMMVTSTFTVYSINGKEIFREMACNPDALDDASAKSLTDLQAVLVTAKVPVK